ncbi:Transcriptional coactivator YAP1 [Lamellibrachia satsuma]|nr:Transcriptional coactivator YAP1 [Lamellibrachia satsuma]
MSDQLGKLVVHVRGDSDSDLDALFNVLKNVDPSQQQNSFKHRNLPASFFKPPEPRPGMAHSREGSQDSTSTGYSVASGHRPTAHGSSGLAIAHGRSLSSPAQLPHTLSAVPPPPIHVKQQSLAGEFTDELGHLPQSWELNKAAGSGADQRYFLNHADHRTTWQDPRKSMSTSALNQSQTLSPPQSHQSSSLSLTNLNSPLPPGWEQAVTPEGEVYFINHIDKCTSWYDPRRLIPCCTAKHLQGPGPVKINSASGGPLSQPQPPPLGPPLSPNQQPAQGAPLPQRTSEQLIRVELQRLQQQKARLQREQEEIARQEVMLKRATQPVAPAPVFTPGLTPSMQASSQPQQRLFEGTSTASRPFQEMLRSPPNVSTPQPDMVTGMQTAMQSVSTSGVDPFLGQGGNSLESHARQNSGDSGLGGMGNSYSLPRTPEDFLSNVDEMDSQESHKVSKPASADFPTATVMQGVMSMEVAQVADPGDTATSMDCCTDDLVSTLQGDISSELLSDMEMQKIDSLLTWL